MVAFCQLCFKEMIVLLLLLLMMMIDLMPILIYYL